MSEKSKIEEGDQDGSSLGLDGAKQASRNDKQRKDQFSHLRVKKNQLFREYAGKLRQVQDMNGVHDIWVEFNHLKTDLLNALSSEEDVSAAVEYLTKGIERHIEAKKKNLVIGEINRRLDKIRNRMGDEINATLMLEIKHDLEFVEAKAIRLDSNAQARITKIVEDIRRFVLDAEIETIVNKEEDQEEETSGEDGKDSAPEIDATLLDVDFDQNAGEFGVDWGDALKSHGLPEDLKQLISDARLTELPESYWVQLDGTLRDDEENIPITKTVEFKPGQQEQVEAEARVEMPVQKKTVPAAPALVAKKEESTHKRHLHLVPDPEPSKMSDIEQRKIPDTEPYKAEIDPKYERYRGDEVYVPRKRVPIHTYVDWQLIIDWLRKRAGFVTFAATIMLGTVFAMQIKSNKEDKVHDAIESYLTDEDKLNSAIQIGGNREITKSDVVVKRRVTLRDSLAVSSSFPYLGKDLSCDTEESEVADMSFEFTPIEIRGNDEVHKIYFYKDDARFAILFEENALASNYVFDYAESCRINQSYRLVYGTLDGKGYPNEVNSTYASKHNWSLGNMMLLKGHIHRIPHQSTKEAVKKLIDEVERHQKESERLDQKKSKGEMDWRVAEPSKREVNILKLGIKTVRSRRGGYIIDRHDREGIAKGFARLANIANISHNVMAHRLRMAQNRIRSYTMHLDKGACAHGEVRAGVGNLVYMEFSNGLDMIMQSFIDLLQSGTAIKELTNIELYKSGVVPILTKLAGYDCVGEKTSDPSLLVSALGPAVYLMPITNPGKFKKLKSTSRISGTNERRVSPILKKYVEKFSKKWLTRDHRVVDDSANRELESIFMDTNPVSLSVVKVRKLRTLLKKYGVSWDEFLREIEPAGTDFYKMWR